MISINTTLLLESLKSKCERLFELSAQKIDLINKNWNPEKGSPVFTIKGEYTTRGWTEWTQGFQFGAEVLQFDATGDKSFLQNGKNNTLKYMATHISHIGVHDHGFNNVSTFGNLLRLAREGAFDASDWEINFYELALKLSGAIQASRWTDLPDGLGFVTSFNGPHSLFADTIRSMRALVVAHKLGHALMGEKDVKHNLLKRALQHAITTAEYNVYFGKGRDSYDVRGRTAHESIFNLKDGSYRCPNSQQGFSPFTTWTRGLAWILCGYPEQLEFLSTLDNEEFSGFNIPGYNTKQDYLNRFLETALAVADFYIENTPTDGIPYWDTGALNLHKIDNYLDKPADPFNAHEPVDSSAAAIAAQGLLRLGQYLQKDKPELAIKYFQTGLTVANTLLDEPYISTDAHHQGLILHSVYHQPNGWDYVPDGQSVPCGESSMWGDYHARELALYVSRLATEKEYYTFFNKI